MNENVPQEWYTLSLIIPAHNEEAYIWACLDSVLAHANGLIDEIIVVDNVSTDQTNVICKQYAAHHAIIRVVTETQKWPTYARQRWYIEAKGDLLAYIDADTRTPPWWTSRVISIFSGDHKLWFLSGPYTYYDLVWYKQIASWIYRRLLAYPTYLLTGYMWVGGNFVIKRSILDAIHGFDMSIIFYGDDTDIARRAKTLSKVRFDLNLAMPTSARRLIGQWLLKTAWVYMINFFSQVLKNKSVTHEYKDFR